MQFHNLIIIARGFFYRPLTAAPRGWAGMVNLPPFGQARKEVLFIDKAFSIQRKNLEIAL
jgi:hypothetical protein